MSITKFSGAINGNYYPLSSATISATTGSPTVDTSSRSGKTIYKFTGSGSITVSKAGTAEILVVGGGGGTGFGGGGAGGVLYDTSAYLASGTLNVVIGAGGAKGYVGQPYKRNGLNGESSLLGSYVAVGGGGSGTNYTGYSDARGNNGGSGGGGVYDSGIAYPSGIGLTGQGNNGGNVVQYFPAGGGGAGAAGGAGSGTSTPANGGAGRSISITGSSVTYGGGGGGSNGYTGGSPYGSGGSGGGGAGNGTSGTANTGGGAGGAFSADGGNGGSGIVIVVIG